MAIGKPKAIDDAPAGRGPHRACAMGWPQGRSAAEDGGGRLSCLARNGQTGVPTGLAPWGGKPRGRKSIRPPLRLRRSRRSRPSARSSHGEAVWSARRTASSGEDVADVERPAQEARLSRRRKGNSWRSERTTSRPGNPCGRRRRRWTRVSVGLEAHANPSAQTKALALPGHADEPHSPRRNSTCSTMRTAQPHPSRVAPASGNDAGPPAPRRSTCGGTNSDMRAQAVPPTRTAPTIAKASRQPSDGTPIWASPNVAW